MDCQSRCGPAPLNSCIGHKHVMPHPPVALEIFAGVLAIGIIQIAYVRRTLRLHSQERFIRSYVFSESVLHGLKRHHSVLEEKDLYLVARALREFFIVRPRAGTRMIGMPSKVVDDLWHEFILHTQDYQQFCRGAFGGLFHHVPALATPKGVNIKEGMRVTWRLACLEENINPSKAIRLPLLFAIDEKLSIVNGNRYNTKQMNVDRKDVDNCAGVACSGGDCTGSGHGCGGHGCGGGCGGH
jgi:hypothetical protein